MKRLAILGASGHGKVVADAAELAGWNEIFFFDDAWPAVKENAVWPISGNSANLKDDVEHFDGVVVAIGNNIIRLKKWLELKQAGAKLKSIVHPAAIVSRYASIGPGSVIFAHAAINAGASIGEAVIVNTGATVDHDCLISKGVHLGPGSHLAGGINVGELSWIGIGACVREMIQIGSRVTVGAGSVVIRNIPDDQIFAGVPAVAVKK